MKKLKLSQWHDGSVKPVHVGVYQNGCEEVYQFWNGSFWCSAKYTIEDAVNILDRSFFQNDK